MFWHKDSSLQLWCHQCQKHPVMRRSQTEVGAECECVSMCVCAHDASKTAQSKEILYIPKQYSKPTLLDNIKNCTAKDPWSPTTPPQHSEVWPITKQRVGTSTIKRELDWIFSYTLLKHTNLTLSYILYIYFLWAHVVHSVLCVPVINLRPFMCVGTTSGQYI